MFVKHTWLIYLECETGSAAAVAGKIPCAALLVLGHGTRPLFDEERDLTAESKRNLGKQMQKDLTQHIYLFLPAYCFKVTGPCRWCGWPSLVRPALQDCSGGAADGEASLDVGRTLPARGKKKIHKQMQFDFT